MYHPSSYTLLVSLLRQRPAAIAGVKGSDAYPKLRGEVLFYETRFGVFAVADIMGLPDVAEACGNRYFGFHIHTVLPIKRSISSTYSFVCAAI